MVKFCKQSSVFDLNLERFSFKLPASILLVLTTIKSNIIVCIMTVAKGDNETGEVMQMSLKNVPFILLLFFQAIFHR